jgi:hypothetical protein
LTSPGPAHPFAPRVRTRYLHQLVAFGPTLAGWTRALHGLCTAEGGRTALVAARRARLERLTLCFDRVPFWQARFRALGWGRHQLADSERWALLPPLTRADLQANLDALMPHPLPPALRSTPDDVYEGLTSGSTGQPVRFRMSGAAYHGMFPVVSLVRRWLRLPTLRPGRGYALLDALGHSPEYGAHLPLCGGLRFEKLTVGRPDWQGRLRRLRPQIVTGDPDSLAALLDTDVRPDLVLSSAFALPAPLQADLVRHLRCPVVEYYSAAETGPLALRCPAAAGWHVLTPFVHVDAVAAPDTGEALLLTDLRNEALPLLRYAVGDRGRVDPEITACACGLHTPRIHALEGRTSVSFVRPDGTAWNPAPLGPSLGRLPVRDFELSEVQAGRLCLRYHGAAPLDAGALEALAARVRAVAGAGVRLDAHFERDAFRAPGVKPRPFIALGGQDAPLEP